MLTLVAGVHIVNGPPRSRHTDFSNEDRLRHGGLDLSTGNRWHGSLLLTFTLTSGVATVGRRDVPQRHAWDQSGGRSHQATIDLLERISSSSSSSRGPGLPLASRNTAPRPWGLSPVCSCTAPSTAA